VTARRVLVVGLAGVGVALVAVGIVKLVGDDSEGGSSGSGSSRSLTAALDAATPADSPFPELTAARIAVGGRCIRVVVADTLAERVDGLRQRRDVGEYDGMLFVFDGATDTAFTMSTVPVPLDIGFYDGTGRLVSDEHMLPCPKAEDECPVYRADGRFSYALETVKGKLPAGSLSGCA
jgi:uncharacterized membrane protein (UPF0127 family)